MDYEKAYKEALKRAKGFKTDEYKDVAKYIFPELRESEDERIRTALIEHFRWNVQQILNDFDNKEVLAWLEKQGEQKPAENKGMNLVEEEMTPFQKKVFCIIDMAIEREQGLKQVCDELLALASNEIKQNPALSEEDKDVIDTIIWTLIDREVKEGHPDEYESEVNWLKSLKERVQPQPKQEILEKLKEWLDEYVSDLADVDTASLICSFTNYLDGKLPNSLRPQNRWKPSGEQIQAVKEAACYSSVFSEKTIDSLISLSEQLKKLKGY